MIDVEPLIRDELDRAVPVTVRAGDWHDVRRRAGGRRRRVLLVAGIAGVVAAAVALAATPLGGALARTLGGFSDWLTGTPGEPAPPRVQKMFEQATRRGGAPFPGNPRLRLLLHVDRDGRRFSVYGFETGGVVCLRNSVRGYAAAGPESACVSRADLRRSGDLVVPVKANLGAGEYLMTYGIAAAEVTRVTVDGHRAALRNGTFLYVGRRGTWARTVTANGRNTVPLSIENSHVPRLATGLKPHGPTRLEREVRGGTIGWFVRREPRGVRGHLRAGCCKGFVRVIYPDPNDFLAVVVGDKTASTFRLPPGAPKSLRPRGPVICIGLLTHGTTSAGCNSMSRLFRQGPLDLSWGFSGVGQQLWIVSGVASDEVARIEVFLGTGQHWRAPLRDNATVFRVQRAKFPVRVVAYDRGGRVIGIVKVRV